MAAWPVAATGRSDILGIHHVHAGSSHQAGWDIAFLVLGALLLIGGYLLQRSGQPFDPDAPRAPQAQRRRRARLVWRRPATARADTSAAG